jgi:hypothetical protein
MELLISTLLGGLFRLIPELLKVYQRYMDNQHELEMIKQSGIIESNRIDSKIAMNNDVNIDVMNAIIELQSKKSGNKFIDSINALVRPSVTYIILGLYTIIKLWFLFTDPLTTISTIWTTEDMSILSGILSFWFVGRVLEKKS